ncbi:MAG: protein translocase subunit SecF [Candidatus Moranbacteria bacterium]|nr:protein translocase subunit SecF [Candidatus Moranbacteria bacterium]MDD3965068.1 protein translocase subunit SecF [Candidatus Moranbacteria bacterium]
MINIIQKRVYLYIFSLGAVFLSIGALFVWGLNLGIDFKGGTLMEVQFSETVPAIGVITESLAPFSLQSLTIQPTGERSLFLRYLASDEVANEQVLEKLQSFDENILLLRTDFIGGSVSEQIKKQAIIGIILSIIGIALYIAWAFRRVSGLVGSWEYGLGAIIALAHDIIVTIGVFSFLGEFYGVEIGVPFVAALLTILGYSVNDTIVVYDRIRENLLRSNKKEDFEITVNRSINETLGRSFNTSFTVIVTLLAIVLFGGESIKYFALAILIGVAFGTYSSIYVASALLVTRYKMKMRG